jgi:alanine dehydrogenase
VTALRTAAAGVLAVDVLDRADATSIAVVGAGVNGTETARLLIDRGRTPVIWDVDHERRHHVALELGAVVADSLDQALACDAVVTVTPGRSILFPSGSLRPGQHVSLMGADGPGKAEIAVQELARARLFCDDWEQASHGGELAAAVGADVVRRDAVTELGAVLAGEADGRRSDDEITLFDSTGLAIQDLAIARAAFMKTPELHLPRIDL